MYKVFFADDEAAMRTGLRDSINWDNSDFTLVGEAPDGELALPLISELLPDILITDVKMPFMDGIELSRRVARTMPWVKIIILSGHDEFEYAKQAIRIGVSEYLLKPVTSEILFQALEAAARQIEAERERRRAIEDLEENLRKAATGAQKLRREKFFSNLVYGMPESSPPDPENIPAAFADAAVYQAALIRIFPREGGDNEGSEESEEKNFAQARSSIFEILAPNENAVSFPEGAERVVCVFAAGDEKTLEEEVYATAQAVRYDCERRNPCAVSVAVGSSVGRMSELPKSMAWAKKTMAQMETLRHSLILSYKDIALAAGGAQLEAKKISGPKGSRCDGVIERAEAYIAEHCAEPAVSLNAVAEFVGLSPNHFSTVFRQETGETFIESLTRQRIERAKILLRTTAARASEIAYLVGYNDSHYFSYVFKKNTGVSPSEFRK